MGIKERKIRDQERRKQLILDTAKRIYTHKGLSHLTLDDIASEIEFSKGTIYSHFESKEEIFAQILLEHLELLHRYLEEVASTPASFEEGLRRCLRVYFDFYEKHREYFQLLFFVDLFGKETRVPQKLLKDIQYQKLACLSQLQRIISRGIKSQEIPNGRSARHMATMLWGMLNGLIQLSESKQIRNHELDPLIRLAFDVVIKGIKYKTD